MTKSEYKKYITDTLQIPLYAAESIFYLQGRLETSPYIKGGFELTKHLERVSGSYEFKREYEQICKQNQSNEKTTFEISKEMYDIRRQKHKLQRMEGYMEDSKGLLEERESLVDQIDD